MVNDLRNDYEQLSRRNEFDIEEKVRQVMYESIKEHNISRNQILEQNKVNLIKVIDEKVIYVQETLEGFQTKLNSQQAELDNKIAELGKSARMTKMLITKCALQSENASN